MATLTTSYQQIASKYIGTVSGSGVSAKDLYLRIYAKYTSQSISDNKSYVSYKSTLYVDGSGTYFYTGSATTKTLSGTGATTISADAQGNYYIGETTLCETTGTITHGSNGAASVSITASWASTPWGVTGSLTGTADLPTIARATTPVLANTTITMGSAVNITLTPANNTFKHKLRYDFGSVSGSADGFSIGAEFTAQGNATVTFTPPTSLGNQIPNATSGTGKITCYTYTSSGTHIGTTYVNITLDVPSYTPTITGITLTHKGQDKISGVYVEGKSSVEVAATVGTSYGAGTKSITTVIDGKTYSGLPFETAVLSNGSKTAKITFVDTRDKSVTLESSAIQVYAYSIPNITEFTLKRDESDNTKVVATVKGSISAINNKNTKTIKVTLGTTTNTITSSSYTINATTTFTGVPTDSTLTGKAIFTDSYTSIERASALPTVAVTMDFYNDGKGIAMGKVAEKSELLDVAWEIKTGKPEKTLSNLSFRGNNLISKNADDTIQNWSNQGNLATTFYDDSATGITKPSTWGFLLNVTNGPGTTEAHQLWFEQSNGNVFHRGGNSSGFGDWKALIDTANFSSNFSSYFPSHFSSNLNATIKDYVVEQGTSDIWTYRKWNSGIAECWGIYTMASSCTTAWGSLYYSNKTTPRINYPFTFKSRPQETVSLRLDAYSAWPYADSEGKGMNTTTQTAVYGFLRPSTMGETTIRYEFTVIGRWK